MGMATIPPPQSVDEQIGAPKRRLGAFLKWTITHRRWVTLVVIPLRLRGTAYARTASNHYSRVDGHYVDYSLSVRCIRSFAEHRMAVSWRCSNGGSSIRTPATTSFVFSSACGLCQLDAVTQMFRRMDDSIVCNNVWRWCGGCRNSDRDLYHRSHDKQISKPNCPHGRNLRRHSQWHCCWHHRWPAIWIPRSHRRIDDVAYAVSNTA
ncbi:MAG: hypothetical protein KatS3mg111_4161 [Pirellulaceae bacterium]|nr:MAG: hypothetical protein KatS3mg111_4161 [Pirellulaceae bacterium]